MNFLYALSKSFEEVNKNNEVIDINRLFIHSLNLTEDQIKKRRDKSGSNPMKKKKK